MKSSLYFLVLNDGTDFSGVTGVLTTMNGTNFGTTYVMFEEGAKRVTFNSSSGGSIYFCDSSRTILAQYHGQSANVDITFDLTAYPTACMSFYNVGTLKKFQVD